MPKFRVTPEAMEKFPVIGADEFEGEESPDDRFDKKNAKRDNEQDKKVGKEIAKARSKAKQRKMAPPVPFEPRCTVCNSPFRDYIDAMLARGAASYTSIAEKVPGADGHKLSRQAVTNHAEKHLGFQEDAIRRILEAEAVEVAQNYQDNVRGAMTRRGALEIAMRKGFEDLVAGRTDVEVKDLLAIVQALEKMDETTSAAQVDQMRMQTEAFIRAIREEVDDEKLWERIVDRTKRIISQQGYTYEPTVDAEAVEAPDELPAG